MAIIFEEWQPSDGVILESSALEAIKDLGNSLVMAGPGTGKTELLAQKAVFLLETNICNNPKKILAISFKKDSAFNLKERVKLRLSNNLGTRFTSLTYDSFAKGILDRFMYALPEEYRPAKNYEVALSDNKINEIISNYNNLNDINQSIIPSIAQLTINKLPFKQQNHNEIFTRLIKGKDGNGPILNFSMINRLAIHILENNPLILKALRITYSHVFIDEFQDTTELQYDLVKACFLGSESSITAVGDKRQRIMLWAGAKKDIFENFKLCFKSNEYTLLMNHRSSPKLLEIQKIVNNYLQDSPYNPKSSPKWMEEEGHVELLHFIDSNFEIHYIAKQINYLINRYDIPRREICIIVKQNVQKYCDEVIDILEDFGIQARDEAKYQDLLKEDLIILLINTLKASLNNRDADSWLFVWNSKIFFEGKYGTSDSKTFDRIRKQTKIFLKDIRLKVDKISCEYDMRNLMYEIIAFYDIHKLKKYYPQYIQGQYINNLIDKFSYNLYLYFEKSSDFISSLDSFEGNNSIPIITIHKSKGLEYEAVFFLGFDDNEFWKFSSQREEDTCTFFVGLSRSKRFLYFTFSKSRFGKKRKNFNISILYSMLRESGVVDEKYIT